MHCIVLAEYLYLYLKVYWPTYNQAFIQYSASMNIENTKAQMRKGVLEYCILQLLMRSEMYPGDIIEALKEVKLIVVEGTLYPMLTRLKNSGILEYRWEESKSGPPRKYYKLTPLGQVTLKELDDTWLDLQNAVNRTTNKLKP